MEYEPPTQAAREPMAGADSAGIDRRSIVCQPGRCSSYPSFIHSYTDTHA